MHSKAAAEELSIEGCVGSWLQFWFETDLEVSSINPFLLSNLQKENSRWSSSRAAVLPAASSGLPSQEVWCYGCQQLSTTLLLSFFVCASCHLQKMLRAAACIHAPTLENCFCLFKTSNALLKLLVLTILITGKCNCNKSSRTV